MQSSQTIVKGIRAAVLDSARRRLIREVRVGLRYTAVALADGFTGLAWTSRAQSHECCLSLDSGGSLAGSPAVELLDWITGDNPLKRSVALATANALVGEPNADIRIGDILEELEFEPGERIGMVGLFKPLVPKLRARGADLEVFELNPELAVGLHSNQAALERLPGCQIALITATAIINGTLDALLEAVAGCREVILLGPSTPMLPEVFLNTPVTGLSGVVVHKPEVVLRIVSEGGGTPSFGDSVGKVNIPLHPRQSSTGPG